MWDTTTTTTTPNARRAFVISPDNAPGRLSAPGAAAASPILAVGVATGLQEAQPATRKTSAQCRGRCACESATLRIKVSSSTAANGGIPCHPRFCVLVASRHGSATCKPATNKNNLKLVGTKRPYPSLPSTIVQKWQSTYPQH